MASTVCYNIFFLIKAGHCTACSLCSSSHLHLKNRLWLFHITIMHAWSAMRNSRETRNYLKSQPCFTTHHLSLFQGRFICCFEAYDRVPYAPLCRARDFNAHFEPSVGLTSSSDRWCSGRWSIEVSTGMESDNSPHVSGIGVYLCCSNSRTTQCKDVQENWECD